MKFLYPTGARPLDGYTIKRGVGRGGFGEVYFATSDAGKEVALKLIRRNLDVELRGVTHCLNLKHPNLIALYDIREDVAGDQWVIMEYVAGESLDQVIERFPTGMAEADASRWFREMCAGVAYLHDHGIVHRDLKPANVFLDGHAGSHGTVKIGDYGLAKFISCSRRSGQTESVGTVHYMAPEIANGRYGREVDTYALGVMLYEMLTGRVPFEGESMGEVIMKHLTAEPDLSLVPHAFRDAVKRALAKDPALRVGSVGEMLALLPGGVAPAVDATPIPAPDGLGDSRQFTSTEVRGVRRPAGTLPPLRGEPIQEPLAKAIADNWHRLMSGWYAWDVNPAFKGLLLFAIVAIAVTTSPGWLTVGMGLGFVYLAYYIIWSAFVEPGMRSHRQRAVSSAQPVALAAAAPATPAEAPAKAKFRPNRPLRTQDWLPIAHKQLREEPFRDKVGSWIVSLLKSAMLCAVLSLVALPFASGIGETDRIALHLWMTLVTTAGAWSAITVARFAEGRFEDQVPHFAMSLAGGLLVGLVAVFASETLMIGQPFTADFGLQPNDTAAYEMFNIPDRGGHSSTGLAMVPPVCTLTYMTLMFGLLRWWRVAEFTRERRLSVTGVIGTMVLAWLVHILVWYPQPAGMAVAGVSAVAVSLASPWMRPSQRRALAEAV